MNQVVVHFKNGKVVKGKAHDIYKTRRLFHLEVPERPGKTFVVQVKDIKAIFFVRDINPPTQGGMGHLKEGEKEKSYGRKAIVHFHDGESITGYVQAFHKEDPILVLVPEIKNNNERIFINKACVKKFKWLEKETTKEFVNPFA